MRKSLEERKREEVLANQIVDADKHVTHQWAEGGRGHYTKQEDLYMRLLAEMLPEFKKGSVLEIGPGTGEFARRMFETYDITEYSILDLESHIDDSRRLLDSHNLKANYVFSQNYLQLADSDFTLFVSNVCLPEVPEYYRQDLVDKIFPHCEMAFVIGGNEFSNYNEWIQGEFWRFFENVTMGTTGYCGTFAISGSRKGIANG